MKRYMIQDGVIVEDPRGGFIEYDDVIGELLSRADKQNKAIAGALEEIRELRLELLQSTIAGREILESDREADLDGF